MAVIDDKVVAMSFESKQFEKGVDDTLRSISKLKDALRFPEAGKGLNAVSASAKEIDLGHISKGVDSIIDKLGALRLTAIAVFAQIATKAVAAGTQLVKSLTIDAVIQGYKEYETQINAVQTILANTAAAGTKIGDVNKALDELNTYADKTIYNFSEMTRNIGTFTAAGVDLKTATASIKGIANMAAVSGSNAQQASTAMYQLSQAISAGSVKLMDWNSVVNAGMGGSVFQRALAQTAMHMGTLKKGAVELQGPMKNVRIDGESFRNSLTSAGPGKEGWLTGKVLTNTLKQLSGDMTDAQLKAEGYTDAQIKAIQTQAKLAVDAATRVKTLTQLITTTKEALGSGWAQTWRIVVGDFIEARELFTGISNAFNEIIGRSADARNNMLRDWKKLGGRTALIESIKNMWEALGAVLKPIRQAFRDIFPPTTGKQLADLTKRFKEFTETLMPSPETVENLKRTFRGLFALLDIGKQIVQGMFSVFRKVFGTLGQGTGGFLELTAKIGDFLVKVDLALRKGDRLQKFFDGLGTVLAAPLKLLGMLASAIGDLFSGGISGQVSNITGPMDIFRKALEKLSVILGKFLDQLGDFGDVFRPFVEMFVAGLQQMGPLLEEAVRNMNFEAILAVIRTALFGGLVLMLKNFFGRGAFADQIVGGFAGLGGGLIRNISGSFAALSGALGALQANLKAKTLKEIAIAVALLAVSMVALSFVDPKKLNSALSAITIAFGQLLAAMAVLGNITKTMGFVKIPVIAGSLILLAGAINVLAVAVIAFSFLSWEKLAKGLVGVGASLGILIAATGPLSKMSPRLVVAGAGITAIGVGLNILALAVRQFGSMNLQMIGKGLTTVAVSLGVLIQAMNVMPVKGMIRASASVLILSVALNALALAVRQFGSMDWRMIGTGLAGVGASLLVIAGAMRVMPGMVVTAAGLLLVSIALQGIGLALRNFGGMSWKEIARGLTAMAASLVILAIALKLMDSSIVGAIALTVAAAGITLIAGALRTMGEMSWRQIIKGLVALAAALGILAGMSALLAPITPAMLGFAVALLAVGAAIALVGAGVFLIATGLAALATAAPIAAGAGLQAMVQFARGMQENAKLLILGLLEIVRALAKTAPLFVDAIVKILESVFDAIIKLSPKLVDVVDALVVVLIKVLDHNQDKIIQAGIDLIIALLKGIRDNIREVVKMVVEIIAELLKGIAQNIGKIVDGGVQIFTALLKGITSGYTKIVATVLQIITKFLTVIGNNLGKIYQAGLGIISKLLSGISSGLGKVITAGTNLIVNLIKGIGNAGPRIITAATNAMIKFIQAISKNSVKLADKGAEAIIYFLNGIADVIEKREPEMIRAGMRIGTAIVKGLVIGVKNGLGDFKDALLSLLPGPLKKFAGKLGLNSPSTVFIAFGQGITQGLAKGITDNKKDVENAAIDMSNGLVRATEKTLQTKSPSKVMMEIGQFVGQGFAQGIRGSVPEIQSAFFDMNSRLTEAMRTARETIAEEQAKLDELRKEKKPDKAEIKETQNIIKQNQDLLARSTAAHKEWTSVLKEEKKELVGLAKEFDDVSTRLDEARDKLQELKDIQREAVAGWAEQYGELPEIIDEDAEGKVISGAEQVAKYMEQLGGSIEKVREFNKTLEELKGMGLDETTYRMLLEQGPSAQAFADALLAGGPELIKSMNTLDSKLEGASNTLAKNAGKHLYQAGVDAAQGLVDGLESKKSGIRKAMEDIAEEMIKAIRKKLKIKSPSELFAEIGKFSMEGMAKGFTDSSKILVDSIDAAAQEALTAMEQSMRDISDVVTDQLDPNPTITPILDLTQVMTEAQRLAALQGGIPISGALGQASVISSEQAKLQAEQFAALGGASVKFEQNNYSPEALSEIEIYRQTKNQLSQIKSALATP